MGNSHYKFRDSKQFDKAIIYLATRTPAAEIRKVDLLVNVLHKGKYGYMEPKHRIA
jgi:hypothetical protein